MIKKLIRKTHEASFEITIMIKHEDGEFNITRTITEEREWANGMNEGYWMVEFFRKHFIDAELLGVERLK